MPVVSSQWFCEAFEERTAFAVRITERLLDTTSQYQRIEVVDTEAMGRVLILDGCFMVTERDHFIYHEMLVHPAMAAVPEARHLLIVGGGDGGAVTEAVKYPQLQSVTLCEIDSMVVEACREYFPQVSAGLEDPRVRVICEDGAAFVRDSGQRFDVVLVDSTDPVGPGTALFRPEFYRSVKACLTEGGAAVFQTENPLFMEDVFAMAVEDLSDMFGTGRTWPYLCTVPCYPGGLWSFTFCSPLKDPLRGMPSQLPPHLADRLRYYTPEVHKASFALPAFVRKLVHNDRSAKAGNQEKEKG